MANAVPTYGAQDLGTGDVRALALKMYSGQVRATFDAKTPLLSMVQRQTITSGKSFQFPFIGDADGGEHTPGTERTGNTKPLTEERTVPVDDQEIEAHNWLTKVDENVRHYDVASRYGQKHGAFLANYLESRAARMACLGARQDSRGSGDFPSGILVQRSAAGEAAAYPMSALGSRNLQNDLGEAMQATQERNVMSDITPTFFLTPYAYRVLLQDNTLSSAEYLLNPATNNKVTAVMNMVHGWRVIMGTNMPAYATAAGKPGFVTGSVVDEVTGGESAYRGNFSDTVGFGITHSESLGFLQFGGIETAGPEWDENRRSSFLSAAFHGGIKWLRPDTCVELYASTTAYTASGGVYSPAA